MAELQTGLTVNLRCPVTWRDVQVEEIYLVEGTNTCQVESQLIHRRCLDEAVCPDRTACPLGLECTD